MRKNIIYILTAMPLLAGCLMEYPEMTADGELGIDPTSVTVNLEISADLKLGEEIPDYSDEDEVWMHRITVAAYDAGTRLLEKKETIYEELAPDGELSVDLALKLHAMEYRIVVWADLESEGGSGADLRGRERRGDPCEKREGNAVQRRQGVSERSGREGHAAAGAYILL